ncbi:MAG: fibronectin type III domain-containing protein [Ginsengibacter sp.]
MKKFIFSAIALLLCPALFAQNTNEVKGITITGIKGITKKLSNVIAYDKAHPVPLHYKVPLKPEMEGPEPVSQNPDAKSVSKFGSLVNGGGSTTTNTTAIPSLTSNFLTIWGSYAAVSGRESPYTPPDNCGDVGATQIIATANCRMKVFTKPATGAALSTPTGTSTSTLSAVANIELNAFFANSSLGISGISDPHVRYDRFTGRWFIVAIDVNHRTNNYFCIAVSNTGNITSSSDFKIYYFRVSQTGGSSRDFFDYPTLGVDNRSLYIGGNMFANQTSFSGVNMWVVDKTSLINGSATVTSFPHNLTNTDMYTPQGVQNDDPAATYGYFIGASQTQYSKLVIRRVSYSGSTPVLSGDLNLSTSTMYTPKTVPTLGGTAIDGNDRRLCAAMIKKNKITGEANMWVAQGTLLNSSGIGGSGGDRDGALWMEIGNLTGTPTIQQGATLFDGVNSSSSAAENYIYPTIAMSGQGNSLMGFTSAGASKYAQAAAAQRFRTDAAGTFGPSIDFTSTSSSYNPGANRWGDFTQTVVDPTDDMTMWTFTEYVPTTDAWGVRAAQFLAPPPPVPVLSQGPACGTTTSITITGNSTNNSEFFDPGADGGGPGYNRLNVSVTGPSNITVSNIAFVNPTKVTADVTVPSDAISGTYTLTVTNPDGQKSTSTFDLSCSGTSCTAPTGLSESNITSSSATLTWTSVSGAGTYDVQYKATGSATWTTVNTSSTSVNLTGLSASTTYDWQVRTNCTSGGSSSYASAQFTTSAPATCDAPSALSVSAITTNSATLTWTGASGAISYDVQYKVSGSGSWTTINTSSTSISLSGLNASTSYDWQVRTNCSSGSSSYTPGTAFTTNATVACDAPTGLTTSSITGSSATVSWMAASGAINYDVDYTVAGANSWINVATATSSTSVNITGLNSSQNYDWRVRTNCSSGSSAYAVSNFTTSCDGYEPNNSINSAAAIGTGGITAQIAVSGDVDYYSFSTSGNQKNAQVTLTNLPANYDLTLYDNNGNVLQTSSNSGTTDERVFYNNKKPGTYYIKVAGATSADYSNTGCYTLTVNTSNSTYTANIANSALNKTLVGAGLKVYPVPASNTVTVSFDATQSANATITFINEVGQPVFVKNVTTNIGTNFNIIDVSALQQGIYTVKLNNGTDVETTKLIISK